MSLATVPSVSPNAFAHPLPRAGEPAPAQASQLQDLLRLMGEPCAGSAAQAPFPVPVRRVRQGDVLYREGDRAEAFFFVRSGTFKSFCTGEDGYEQVLGFSARGEALGLDTVGLGRYTSEAVALEDSTVFVLLLRDYFGSGLRNAALDTVVFQAVSAALRRRSEVADVMAAVSAEVRLARFLVHLSQQMRALGLSPQRFHLRMSRRDIASYLGVAHETVSRSFSAMVGWSWLAVDNREVEILDLQSLQAFSRGTRRPGAEAAQAAAPLRAPLRPTRGVAALHAVH